jgi:hypothetical protein
MWLYISPHPSDGPSVHARSAIIITRLSLSCRAGWWLRREREARMERDEKIGERQEGESVRGVR